MLAMRGSHGCKWLHIQLKDLHSPNRYLPSLSGFDYVLPSHRSVTAALSSLPTPA
jgi:hypothetical protein